MNFWLGSLRLNTILNFCGVRNSCYYHKYDTKLEELINKQIQEEQQAAQEYLNIAVSLLHSSISYSGSGKLFMSMSHEELKHMHSLINYQLIRGGVVRLGSVKEPILYNKITMLEAFENALCMESEITKLLDNVVKSAETLKDYHCVDFITSTFLNEQLKAVNELVHHITKLSRVSDDKHALLLYDMQLEKFDL